MQVPAQLDIQGAPASEALRDSINRHIEMLEDRFGRIIACRCAIRGPGERHKTGGLYDVKIWLTLPNNREVAIGRTPFEDERYADLAFAVNDAFKRARRRLQDQARRLQNQVKTHEAQPMGKVTQLPLGANYGFITAIDDGREIYFHRNAVLDDRFEKLVIGSQVAFVEEMGEKGAQATTVRQLHPEAARSKRT